MRAKLGLQGSDGLLSKDVICFFGGLSAANKFTISNGRFDDVDLVSFDSWSSCAISTVCPEETRTRRVN